MLLLLAPVRWSVLTDLQAEPVDNCRYWLHVAPLIWHRSSSLPFCTDQAIHAPLLAAHGSLQGQPGDLLLLAAGKAGSVNKALDRVRQYLARSLGLIQVRAAVAG